MAGCEPFVPRHMPLRGPIPLSAPTAVKGVRIREKAECPCRHRLTAASHLPRHMRASRPDTPPWHRRKWNVITASPPIPRQQRRPDAEPRMQECERCAHELSSTAGMAYRIRPKHPEAGRARLMDEKGAKRLETDQPHSACARSMRHPLHVTGWADEAQTPEASRQHRELHQRVLSRLTCVASPHTLSCNAAA